MTSRVPVMFLKETLMTRVCSVCENLESCIFMICVLFRLYVTLQQNAQKIKLR